MEILPRLIGREQIIDHELFLAMVNPVFKRLIEQTLAHHAAGGYFDQTGATNAGIILYKCIFEIEAMSDIASEPGFDGMPSFLITFGVGTDGKLCCLGTLPGGPFKVRRSKIKMQLGRAGYPFSVASEELIDTSDAALGSTLIGNETTTQGDLHAENVDDPSPSNSVVVADGTAHYVPGGDPTIRQGPANRNRFRGVTRPPNAPTHPNDLAHPPDLTYVGPEGHWILKEFWKPADNHPSISESFE